MIGDIDYSHYLYYDYKIVMNLSGKKKKKSRKKAMRFLSVRIVQYVIVVYKYCIAVGYGSSMIQRAGRLGTG